ncbi:unnamed protein product [Phytophthora lilii]|uniref:Unnamed protein product n=1 Tax=Phytophthora lilii TaxID=2077276 RepID=A0A9W6U188_9STRA|nr:unnamed protein product [Phytophthora lilii]
MEDSASVPRDNALDNDLLAALDEMLSLTRASDAPAVETGCHLADAFDSDMTLALGDIPPALEHLENVALQEQTMPQPAGEAKGSTTSPPHEQRRGKDVRAAPYAKPKPRRRKRPKDELDYLRAQVKDLEEELGKLSSASEGESEAGARDDELFKQWKTIVDRQKAEADRSMLENLKLRSMLEGQLKVAPTSLSDELIYSLLNEGLEAQYVQFDTIMDSTGLSRVLQNSKGIQTFRDESSVAFRHEEARLLPFSVPAVHRAMWSCVRYGKAKELVGRIRTRVVNSDHLNVQILDQLQLPKSRNFEVCARLVMRRYFEKDRIVVVWRGYVELTGSLFVRLHEKGYTSVSVFDFSQNSATNNSSSSVPGCVLRMALQVKPEMAEFESEEEQNEHIGEVTDLVVGSYHRNFGLMYQIIENLLFSDATGGAADFSDEHELGRFDMYKR